MLDWLLTPLSGSTLHHVDAAVAWHARLMALAWGLLMPLGAMAARYFKIAPGQDWPRELDNRLWWHAHRTLQYGGMALAALGVALPVCLRSPGASTAGWHGWLGWLLLALGAIQIVGGVWRGSKGGPTAASMRGDHYDMTPRRRWFERLHKSIGWLALLLAVVVIGLGLRAADAPRWMPALLGLWWSLLGIYAWRLQRAGRCIDTYQAIWGPDPRHPGNRRAPIGLGVQRPDLDPSASRQG
jgi:hypothetical protein